MFVQFVVEPLWKAYSVLDPGEDVAAVLGPIIKGRDLRHVSLMFWLVLGTTVSCYVGQCSTLQPGVCIHWHGLMLVPFVMRLPCINSPALQHIRIKHILPPMQRSPVNMHRTLLCTSASSDVSDA
jgi:hypothetical protein